MANTEIGNGRIAVIAYVFDEWHEVLLDPTQRSEVMDLLHHQFKGKPISISRISLPLDAIYAADSGDPVGSEGE